MDERTPEPPVEDAALRRINHGLIGSALIVAAAGLVIGGLRVAGGICLGGVLAWLNFRWLSQSVRGVLVHGGGRVPPGTAMKFALRWIVVGGAAYAGYRLGNLSAPGILIGLLSLVPACLFAAVSALKPGRIGTFEHSDLD